VKNWKMHNSRTIVLTTTLMLMCSAGLFATSRPTVPPPWIYVLVTNDDAIVNTATFYQIESDGSLVQETVIPTTGTGLGSGYYATNRVGLLHSKPDKCIYISDGGSSDIATIAVQTLTLVGTFKGSASDSGTADGIGLAHGGRFLYASFTGSNTIGIFRTTPGCQLRFLGDVKAKGLNGGTVDGMAANGNILVVAYADGSIESFNITKDKLKSNGDLQNSTGFASGDLPTGVDISQDGHYAIFGDENTSASVVEVSDISSGKLTPTVVSVVGSGIDSDNVYLSPDDSLLYISNNDSGQVSAAYFDPTSGTFGASCTSNVLTGFGTTWFETASLATQLNTGLGSVLYVAELGNPSSIGEIIPQKGTDHKDVQTCSMTEMTGSPVSDPQSVALRSIGVYPPRLF
jgi:6-phosphogluconolactonase (cycloisomerase 2 family)